MSAEEVAKFCPSCGRANPDSHKFCPSCGALMVLTESQPVASGPARPSSQPAPPAPNNGGARVPEPPIAGRNVRLPAGAAIGAPPAPKPVEVKPLPLDPKLAALSPDGKQTELQRLLTRANVERMRALLVPAKNTLAEAQPLAEAIGPIAIAQVAEQQGDLLAMEERWAEAQERYAVAKSADPSRSVAEKKYAEMAVKLADEQALARLGDVMLRGDSIGEILTDPRAGKRNAFLAMLTSALVPGLGQMLAGQFIKGGIVMAIWLACMAIIGLSPDKDAFFGMLTGVFNPNAAKGLPKEVGLMSWVAIGGILLTWVFAVFEAPLGASKTQALVTSDGQQIDKSGWEP
ncbi:MAG: zinc ribbon domain-containing protein [Armatimonas sp.]